VGVACIGEPTSLSLGTSASALSVPVAGRPAASSTAHQQAADGVDVAAGAGLDGGERQAEMVPWRSTGPALAARVN
jgi:hypothetical protein